MVHAPGSRLGPYEIVGPLGAGGMGDVYEARDTRLSRTVAIKVSKEAFEERFRNEVLAVSSLSHPNICALFDVGPDYLVMEHVEGKTLHGPLPVAEALRLATQIADALEHAHRKGIVHRDLKPSNILVTKQGVKVLDFGLAKRLPSALGGKDELTLTAEGTILGTPTYMSPEQIEGKPADERSDIFAFGLVLYEMLTGQRAFDGDSAAAVAAAILEREPSKITTLQPATPPALEDVVLTCLAKDPAERWQSVRELKHALAWATRSGPVRRVGGWTMMAAIASAVVAAAFVFAVAHRRDGVEKPPQVRFQISLPDKARSDDLDLAVSPDGRKIALSVGIDEVFQLYVRPLDSLDLTPVPGSETAFEPFWSPDGRQIAFVSPSANALKKVDLAGGPAQTLCRVPGFEKGAHFSREGATWGREDVIVFSAGGQLFRVPARGGEAEALGTLAEGERGRYWPEFLPDGRHYLYLSIAARPEEQGIYIGALDSDVRRRIVASEYQAAYSPPGQLLFVKDDALMAQPFDVKSLTLSGEPVPVLEQLAAFKIPQPAPHALYSVSTNGVLAWRPRGTPLLESKQLTWFDRSGEKIGTLGEPGVYFAPALSPDEKSVAVCRMDSRPNPNLHRDLWIFDVARGTSRRLTFDPADDCGPAWSPDGSRIAFFSDRRGTREIYEKKANGSGDDELLLGSKDQEGHDPLGMSTEDWSSDGRLLVYNAAVGTHYNDLFLLPLSPAGKRKPIPFLATAAQEHMGTIAPNGRWLAYRSDSGAGSGRIYVSDISPRGEPGPGKWQISTGDGWQPRWRRDGKELFYSAGATVMAVAVKPDAASFEAGVPRALFDVWLTDAGVRDRFAVTRDGQRFLVNLPLKSAEPVRVLVNWLPPGK